MRLTVHMTNRAEQTTGYHEWTVGDRLRAARETVTTDQKLFAEMIGISRNALRHYERNLFVPRPPVLAAWCLATGFDRNWVMTGELPDSAATSGATARKRRGQWRDNRLFVAIPSSSLKTVA